MRLFDKEWHAKNLRNYYEQTYGEQDTDHWCDQPAANVWVFRRGQDLITLKSNLLTGQVEEWVETV